MGGELEERMLQGMSNAIDQALSFGVTTYDDVMVHRSFIPMILKFKERGGFEHSRVRGTFYINHHMPGDMRELRSFLVDWKELDRESDDHLVLGRSVKMGTDGVSANHTAYMLEPYSDVRTTGESPAGSSMTTRRWWSWPTAWACRYATARLRRRGHPGCRERLREVAPDGRAAVHSPPRGPLRHPYIRRPGQDGAAGDIRGHAAGALLVHRDSER